MKKTVGAGQVMPSAPTYLMPSAPVSVMPSDLNDHNAGPDGIAPPAPDSNKSAKNLFRPDQIFMIIKLCTKLLQLFTRRILDRVSN